jgi:hypothetical protein
MVEERGYLGPSIAQMDSRILHTAEARLDSRSSHTGFVVDKVTLGQVFSDYFGFPFQFSFQTHVLSGGCYNKPISGRRSKLIQFHPIPPKKKKLLLA